MNLKALISLVALCGLAACGERDRILPGERLGLDGEALVVAEVATETVPFAAPAPETNDSWTHRNGSARHSISHPALEPGLSLVWSTEIGAGNGRRQRITAEPIVGGGRIYVMDSAARVSAVSPDGTLLWFAEVAPALETSRTSPGGALAYGGGTVFLTDGFGRLLALDAGTGATEWEQDLGAIGGAPTVSRGIVYVAARDGTGWAVDAETGRVLWTLTVAGSPSNLVSGPGPAISDTLALFPFASGEVVATFRQGGFRRWSATVSGERSGQAYARISDITGDPVIVGDRVYVGNQSGRLVALSLGSGERLWTAEEGAYSPVWVSGGSVFLISDLGALVRLDARTGRTIWSEDLPFFENDTPRRRDAVFAHYGPVLAGGLLRVASSDGALRSFDPASGALVSQVDLPGGAASGPVIAGETAYVVSGSGQLHAFR